MSEKEALLPIKRNMCY